MALVLMASLYIEHKDWTTGWNPTAKRSGCKIVSYRNNICTQKRSRSLLGTYPNQTWEKTSGYWQIL